MWKNWFSLTLWAFMVLSTLSTVSQAQTAESERPETFKPCRNEQIERQLFDDMNEFRTISRPVPLLMNQTLNDVACIHASRLAFENAETTDPYQYNGTILYDWLEEAGYESYPLGYGAATDIFVSYRRSLSPNDFMQYWFDNQPTALSYRQRTVGTIGNDAPFYSARYREVGVAYIRNDNTGYDIYVFVFGSEPGGFPLGLTHPPFSSRVFQDGAVVTSRDLTLIIPNEVDSNRSGGNTSGAFRRMRVSESVLSTEDEPCSNDNAFPPFESYVPGYQLTNLSQNDGEKTLYVQLCDTTDLLTETQITFYINPTEEQETSPAPIPTETNTPTTILVVTATPTPTEAVQPIAVVVTATQTPTEISPPLSVIVTATPSPTATPPSATSTSTATPTQTATPNTSAPTAPITIYWRPNYLVILNGSPNRMGVDLSGLSLVGRNATLAPGDWVVGDDYSLSDVRPGSCLVAVFLVPPPETPNDLLTDSPDGLPQGLCTRIAATYLASERDNAIWQRDFKMFTPQINGLAQPVCDVESTDQRDCRINVPQSIGQ